MTPTFTASPTFRVLNQPQRTFPIITAPPVSTSSPGVPNIPTLDPAFLSKGWIERNPQSYYGIVTGYLVFFTLVIVALIVSFPKLVKWFTHLNWKASIQSRWYVLFLLFFVGVVATVGLLLYLVFNGTKEIVKQKSDSVCLVREVFPLDLTDLQFAEFSRKVARTLNTIAQTTTSWSVCSANYPSPLVPDFDLRANVKAKNVFSGEMQNSMLAYYSTKLDVIIISFAGTASFDQWIANANFQTITPEFCAPFDPQIKVSNTFSKMYESLRTELLVIISSLAGPATKLFITGHSLGGSLAAVCYLDLILSHIGDGRRALYTFGSPRTGNQRFTELISADNCSFRVFNTEDIVVSLPFPVMPGNAHYSHFGESVSFSLNLDDLALNHTIAYLEYFKPAAQIFTTAPPQKNGKK